MASIDSCFNKQTLSDLIGVVKARSYEGGTDFEFLFAHLSALDLSKFGAIILFSDGQDSFNEETKLACSFSTPFLIFTSSLQHNPRFVFSTTVTNSPIRFLNKLAESSGGRFFSTNPYTPYTQSALSEIFQKRDNLIRFLSVEFDGTVVHDFYPKKPTLLDTRGNFVEFAWLFFPRKITSASNAEIVLKFGTPGKVLWEEKIFLDGRENVKSEENVNDKDVENRNINSRLVSQLWAQKKLAELLEADDAENQREVLTVSRAYSMVTPKTSFIVLQDLAEYVKHEIQPPDTLPLILTSYKQLMALKNKSHVSILEAKMDSLTLLWLRRIDDLNASPSSSRPSDILLHFAHPGSSEEKFNEPFWQAANSEWHALARATTSPKKRNWISAFAVEDKFGLGHVSEKLSKESRLEALAHHLAGVTDSVALDVPITTGLDEDEFVAEVPIPTDKNNIGLLIGPRGLTKKKLEAETGATFSVEGEGSTKGGELQAKEAFRAVSYQYHGTTPGKKKLMARVRAKNKEQLDAYVKLLFDSYQSIHTNDNKHQLVSHVLIFFQYGNKDRRYYKTY